MDELHTPVPTCDDPAQVGLFDGGTFDPTLDFERLNAQLRRVAEVMRDKVWRTLEEIGEITGDKEQSISARLRDFRKEKWGGHTVNRRRRHSEDPRRGVFEYQVLFQVA